MSIAQQIPDHIKRASRSFGFALWLDDFDNWLGFSTVIQARLSDSQRAALSYSALRAQSHEQAALTASTALARGVGQPVPPLFNAMDEAAHWADWASVEELDAYCLACFNRMSPRRQADFLSFVQGKAVA